MNFFFVFDPLRPNNLVLIHIFTTTINVFWCLLYFNVSYFLGITINMHLLQRDVIAVSSNNVEWSI